jgi:hypothetical protein
VKRIIIILIIAVIHLGLVIGLALSTFEVSGFMFGVYPQPSHGPLHGVLTTLYTVLMFPFGLVAESLSPGARFLGWPLVVLNSLLWAGVFYMLVVRSFSRQKRKARDETSGG